MGNYVNQDVIISGPKRRFPVYTYIQVLINGCITAHIVICNNNWCSYVVVALTIGAGLLVVVRFWLNLELSILSFNTSLTSLGIQFICRKLVNVLVIS